MKKILYFFQPKNYEFSTNFSLSRKKKQFQIFGLIDPTNYGLYSVNLET